MLYELSDDAVRAISRWAESEFGSDSSIVKALEQPVTPIEFEQIDDEPYGLVRLGDDAE